MINIAFICFVLNIPVYTIIPAYTILYNYTGYNIIDVANETKLSA